MKTVTGVMITKRDIGTVLSCTYTVIDESTGEIVSSNNTKSKLIVNQDEIKTAGNIFEIAQNLVESAR